MTNRPLGLAAIGLAIGFNVPFAMLAAQFDYPDILRRPAGEVLAAFSAGGSGLVLTWYAFALSAAAMIPFALALAFHRRDWQTRPALAISAAVTGVLAGLVQAIGLMRWVFAVPDLARAYADPATTEAQRAAIETGFSVMNLWGGVAIGEHLGQILTLGWIALAAAAQLRGGRMVERIGAALAAVAVAGILIGLGDGLSVALGAPMAVFGMATVAGYLAFSLWLVVSGLGLMLAPRR